MGMRPTVPKTLPAFGNSLLMGRWDEEGNVQVSKYEKKHGKVSTRFWLNSFPNLKHDFLT